MTMNIAALEWIQQWYAENCDGDWEHSYGVSITTLDNPGWSVTINLEGTDLEDKPFVNISIDKSKDDWIRCKVKDTKFFGDGGPRNLTEMLQIFINWTKTDI